jgi:hypothetical protein
MSQENVDLVRSLPAHLAIAACADVVSRGSVWNSISGMPTSGLSSRKPIGQTATFFARATKSRAESPIGACVHPP